MSSTANPSRQSIWLRCETKEFEHRSALTPTTAKKLIEAGWDVTVERDPQRIFKDEEFQAAGATLAGHNTWPNAPHSTPILGLKELPLNDTSPLPHTHIMFGHCFKNQFGWRSLLNRFRAGNGTLYDLEFLQDEVGRRVAAFGFHAGFAGAAVGALELAKIKKGEKWTSKLEPYPDEGACVKHVKEVLESVKGELRGKPIRALVMGALGRCGRGAVDFFQKVGLESENIIQWDLPETSAKPGPYQEILDVDIFVNCIYLSAKIPPFLDSSFIANAGPSRRLSVVVDVSCDTTNPHNPIPIYSINTTFDAPSVAVEVGPGNPPLSMISIDHLPTLLPREASEAFSSDLLPSLLELPQRTTARVWLDAEKIFKEKVREAEKDE